MPFVPAASTVKCAIVQNTAGGNAAVNTLYFRKGGGGIISAADLATVGDFVKNAIQSYYGPATSNTWSVDRLELRAMDVQDGPVLVYTDELPEPGTRTSPALPDNVALCITFYTGLAGRSRRGRVFHGGLTEDAVTNNTVLQAYATNVEDLYQGISLAAIANVWDMVVVSTINNGAPRVAALVTDISTIVARDLRVDTMRKRLD